ncbi:helix-turn-helix domain-containing protein [Dehalococcoidia bacterium]|nr:helix-turn-helix domain-containing protein [Dehalococcoidia bacterium]
MTDERLTLTVEEAAKLLFISRGAAYNAVRTGHIPSLRFGRTIRIPRCALEKMLGGSGDGLDLNFGGEKINDKK